MTEGSRPSPKYIKQCVPQVWETQTVQLGMLSKDGN